MAYGTVKVDNITFDNGGSDQNVTVSGLYNSLTSGITVTGTISGTVVIGSTSVSGTTVAGVTVTGTTVQGASGTFTSLTGTTTQGTTATYTTGSFTSLTGTTTTGTTSSFTSGVFTTLSGATATFTSGIITDSLAFEGSVDDAFETTLTAANPTADQTITLPNATGTVVLSGAIVNADINASAAIVDTKLATIATAGKVSNSATTATSANTASAIVARDASRNFSAGTITAALNGTATNCSRSVLAGTNLTGGGALSSNVTLSLTASPSVTNLQYSTAVWTGSSSANTATTTLRTVTSGGTIYSCNTDAAGTAQILTLQRSASNGNVARFVRGTGAVGSISITASTTSYNTTSDYRLKENVVSLSGAIARLNQLSVHRFNFIVDPTVVVDGFIAHEAAAVVPECVTGLKDAVDEDGDPIYQGIDQSKLVPLLTAALQESIAKIEQLEQRLAAAGIA